MLSVSRPERPRGLRALTEGLLPALLAAGPSLPLVSETLRAPLIVRPDVPKSESIPNHSPNQSPATAP
eukprot:15401354-Alexandrium_andersonii.AAC.1